MTIYMFYYSNDVFSDGDKVSVVTNNDNHIYGFIVIDDNKIKGIIGSYKNLRYRVIDDYIFYPYTDILYMSTIRRFKPIEFKNDYALLRGDILLKQSNPELNEIYLYDHYHYLEIMCCMYNDNDRNDPVFNTYRDAYMKSSYNMFKDSPIHIIGMSKLHEYK